MRKNEGSPFDMIVKYLKSLSYGKRGLGEASEILTHINTAFLSRDAEMLPNSLLIGLQN